MSNLEAWKSGSTLPEEIIVVGAHYDSVIGSPAQTIMPRAWPRFSKSPGTSQTVDAGERSGLSRL